MRRVETRGIVLYNRNFREDDKLVKIFTEDAGKRMFFVRHASQSKLAACIQPLVLADFILKVNPEEGLSYIEDYHHVQPFRTINEDIFRLSYATYVLALADACLQDKVEDKPLFDFVVRTLELMEAGLDDGVLTNIFEMQVLQRFGVSLNLHECAFCHRVGLPFDFSYRFSGVLCPEHYDRDERRSHCDPNVLYLLDQFQSVSFADLERIAISENMKGKIRQFIDQLYEEYVGIHLKPKKFIDDLSKWGQVMKKETRDEDNSH